MTYFSRCLLREVRGWIACGHRPHRELGRDYFPAPGADDVHRRIRFITYPHLNFFLVWVYGTVSLTSYTCNTLHIPSVLASTYVFAHTSMYIGTWCDFGNVHTYSRLLWSFSLLLSRRRRRSKSLKVNDTFADDRKAAGQEQTRGGFLETFSRWKRKNSTQK